MGIRPENLCFCRGLTYERFVSYTYDPLSILYMDVFMTKETTLKHKAHHFFDEEEELLALIPLHQWLMIAGGVLIFLVLPLLFVWSSLGIIHPHTYEQGNYFAVIGHQKVPPGLKTETIAVRDYAENDIH